MVECVPNFSTSDPAVIDAIVTTINQFPDTKVLHTDPDKDYNRTVITFVSTLAQIVPAAVAAIITALERIDMRFHHGEHPRIGSVDVFPLIPLRSTTLEELIPISHEIAKVIGDRYESPVFCYRESASSPARWSLFDVRKGQYEGLSEKLKDPDWQPDYGSATFNSKTGAIVIGVRDFLIAYNVNLTTTDVSVATDIARRIRTSGYIDSNGKRLHGPLKDVQAMGVRMRNRGNFTQVSTNSLDFKRGSLLTDIYAICKQKAEEFGTSVTGSELVGLIPQLAIDMMLDQQSLKTINDLVELLNLNDLYPFDPDLKILDRLVDKNFPFS